MDSNLALVHGPTEPALWSKTLGSFVDEQASRLDNRTSIIFPWQSVRLSYSQLADRSKVLARAMLEMGLRHGDCVGIMAGNCYQYIEVFLGGARIGCPVVVLNNTYTLEELQNAVQGSCKSHRHIFLLYPCAYSRTKSLSTSLHRLSHWHTRFLKPY